MILYRVLSDLNLILYFFTDHPLYLHNVGFWKFSPEFIKNCDWINNLYWLLSSLFDIVCTVVEINHLMKQIRKLKQQMASTGKMAQLGPDDEQGASLRSQYKELRVALIKQWLNLARNVIDLPAIFHFMGNQSISATQAGVCGTATSLISLYGMWGSW